MPEVYVLNKWEPCPYDGLEFDTTSKGDFKDLSPFYLHLPGFPNVLIENLWQFSKVYPRYAKLKEGGQFNNPFDYDPTDEYFRWRNRGWLSNRAHRHPLGKGAKPLYSFVDFGKRKLGYVEARKKIYIPAYAAAVQEQSTTFSKIEKAFESGNNIILRDFDGYDYIKMGLSVPDLIHNTKRPLGHSFVIMALLKGELRC